MAMFKYTPWEENQLNGGTQEIFQFENNYGASVVSSSFSYGGEDGLFELAVLLFNNGDWHLCYSTPITNDVIGWLTVDEVNDLLDQIKAL